METVMLGQASHPTLIPMSCKEYCTAVRNFETVTHPFMILGWAPVNVFFTYSYIVGLSLTRFGDDRNDDVLREW
eukprot:6187836-Pleurochrysis_carterae.AAC.1